jgi:riboflavin kinase/FMN adenylyltransferase
VKLLRPSFSSNLFPRGTVLSIGNFDGVHLGHQALLQQMKAKALQLHLPLVILLFEPQPGEFFKGKNAPARISSLREKLFYLSQAQVDYVCCLPFNTSLAETSAEDFASKYIFSMMRAKHCIVGEDFRFGKGRCGDMQLLKEMAKAAAKTEQVDVEGFPDFQKEHQRVSSTGIRQALSEGNLVLAETLLGRPFSLMGRVVHGDGRGREWGIPTANVHLTRINLPLTGVFAVQLRIVGSPLLWNGVANLGQRPTFGGTKNILEVHLFDFDSNLYGQRVEVYFKHKLRSEVKFESEKALITQIRHDMAEAKQLF